MPPSETGEWWELEDEGRENMSYYYHTKTGETVWTRPDGFVIPLGIIQVSFFRGQSAQNIILMLPFADDYSPGSEVFSKYTTKH